MANHIDRRQFLHCSSLSALHLFVLGCAQKNGLPQTKADSEAPCQTKATPKSINRLGEFIESAQPIHTVGDFKYVVIQQSGVKMSDGHVLGAQPDGMACFQDEQGRYVLLRNQELGARRFLTKYGLNDALFKGGAHPKNSYTDSMFGGVTRVVVDPTKLAKDFQGASGTASTAVVDSQYVLTGTDRNCAGGQFENYWITCEESSEPGHGYAFITSRDDDGSQAPRRVTSWGRFHREAVSVHKASGISYMTEDRKDGCFYRFVPVSAKDPFGAGELQALKIDGLPTTDPYPDPKAGVEAKSAFNANQTWTTSWVTIDDPSAARETCRAQAHKKGGTIFNRCEGITQDASGIWFTASLGGPVKGGQIFHLDRPSAPSQTLTLKYEVMDRSELSCPDNLTVAPWGDLVMAEDNYARGEQFKTQHVRCMSSTGDIYPLLRVNEALSSGTRAGPEFTGACFSPDGKYFFVNCQSPLNMTIAVTGPWPKA